MAFPDIPPVVSFHYLLFHQSFIHELMELGYQDTMWESESLKAFFLSESRRNS
jgi:hypothetical protein